ncbi:MAG: hypothetical protein SV760_09465, partial [Halobacteria archaeon]|nr:hypothetical protein [Halobacteria archaeon]
MRYFVQVDPDDRSQEVLHLRDDLEWTTNREEAVDEELQELLKKGAYESQMESENVSQIIKVG